jgi:hypothetical protein
MPDAGGLAKSARAVRRNDSRAPSQAGVPDSARNVFLAPLLAGLDKFTHLLVNWGMYPAPRIGRLSLIGGPDLMLVLGAVEIIAALIVAVRPRIGRGSCLAGCGPSSPIY